MRRYASVLLLIAVAVGAAVTPWFFTPSAAAQTARQDPILAEMRPQVDFLMELYSQGKIDDMLQRMPAPPVRNGEELEHLRRDLVAFPQVAGRFLGYEIITTQSLGSRYHEVYVLVSFEREPVLFDLGFFRVADAWQVQRFKATTDLGPFLDLMLARHGQ